MEKWPIGIFTSVGAGLGAGLDTVKSLGVHTVQVHAPHEPDRAPDRVAQFRQQFADAGIQVTVVFAGFPGESYADIPTVQKTIGLVPPGPRAERLKETKAISDFAHALGCEALGMHIGFVPEDASDPNYAGVVKAAQEVCDYCKQNGQRFHLETGQEKADVLLRFFNDVGRDNLAINFDPANLILYGTDEPIPALRSVGRYVKSVHCKDAKRKPDVGGGWAGVEVALGQGDVNMELFLRTLKEIGYFGPLTIEREISGEQQKKDIAEAIGLLQRLRTEILG
ncbi:MAG TPA: sugar phosphate isomerase/epimerase family protein [Armatimonadota bacterium]|jgi:sugar phosphate isomerase/epimerase|nr:sugar phosphate isomerase/epimerase [Armatimonadota bacterium]HOQ27497.1 sugar phosphate isomerase/epimerase family protein [Armatimonadota bacterium]HPT97801.1 sugar phosphate isomerase/epimerase family protein [Armatimonadota bacterium]